MSFYFESIEGRPDANQHADEQLDRWDANPSFMNLDSWSDAELNDDRRFAHYLSRKHVATDKANV
jgi:hypothetical protein